MAGLNHSFFLLRAAEHRPEDYLAFASLRGEVELHDDLVRYMIDPIRWIPSFNSAIGERCTGLCLYGPTAIDADGAPVARAVFSRWADLFSCGPSTLSLTGDFAWDDEHPKGHYLTLTFERDEVCSGLRKLAEFAERVVASGGAEYLLHLGI